MTAATLQRRSIVQLGIMTAERPLLLKRALESYIEKIGDNRQIEYVVFDDSKTSAGRQASLETAKEARRKYNVHIRFAGREERAAHVRRLCEYTGIDLAILTSALLVDNGYTLGQNRNALLLDAAGVSCFCVDDDTLCIPVLPPVIETTKIRATLGEDPSEYWCFATADQTPIGTNHCEKDILGAHEALLGKTIGALEDNTIPQVSPHAGSLFPLLKYADSRVRITFNGLAGDCGWGSPFGLWHAPMGYLAFTGASLQRLTSSESCYQEAILSRQLLRVTTAEVLSDFSFSMLTFAGLDNCEMLPPNPPEKRGQDLVFGQMLRSCFLGAVAGHIPIALRHEPIPSRRFWPGEIMRSAAGVDLCRLMIEIINDCEFKTDEITAGQRLQALGRHFLRVARLPDNYLAKYFENRLHESNTHFAQKITASMESLCGPAGAYVADVNRYLEKLRTSEVRENYWIPLDLWSIHGAASAVRQLRENLIVFGRLLDVWPGAFEAAKRLRRDGRRLSVPV